MVFPPVEIAARTSGSVISSIQMVSNVTIGSFSSQPGLTVAIKGTPSQQAPAITVEPTALDFGTVSVNQSKDLSLTIRNTGTATLSVSSITSSNALDLTIGAF